MSTAESGYEVQSRAKNGAGEWGEWARPSHHLTEEQARVAYIRSAGTDHHLDVLDQEDVQWRIVKTVVEEVEPPRTSREVVEWLAEPAPTTMGSEGPIEKDQVWVRKKDGVRVRVMDYDRTWNDVQYRVVESGRSGSAFSDYFRAKYERES